MPLEFDYLIVGAGFSGLVFAERACRQLGRTCLVVDKRDHVGGNAHDEYDQAGVLVHPYGPHYFRTNSDRIKDYLSEFTDWTQVNYRVQSYADGRYWSFPINLRTFEQFIGRPASEAEFVAWLDERRVPLSAPANSEEIIVSQVGWEMYRKFFEGYTLKQWKKHPRDLDASVCGRIPIRTNRNENYLSEMFQALPRAGYHRMFQRMIAACGDRVQIMLKTDYRRVRSHVRYKTLIYTGPIDEYFDHCHGALPYRSLRFEPQSFTPDELVSRETIAGRPGFWQPVLQVNYPNDEAFTRIVELKHATGQLCANTTIMREYPEDYAPGREPYYPIPTPASAATYKLYADRAEAEPNTLFIGRLATYRYYNMDQVVGMALATFERHSAAIGGVAR